MRAKSLKISQILRAHMPYFRRPGHISSINSVIFSVCLHRNTYYKINCIIPVILLFIVLCSNSVNGISNIIIAAMPLLQIDLLFLILAKQTFTCGRELNSINPLVYFYTYAL